jgi:hypothetical protein
MLIALAAIGVSTTSAKADIWLAISVGSSPSIVTETVDLGSGSPTSGTFSQTYQGYSFSGAFGATTSAGNPLPQTLTLSNLIISNSGSGIGGGQVPIAVTLFSSTTTGTVGSPSGSLVLPGAATSGLYNAQAGPGILSATLTVSSNTAGTDVSDYGQYYGYSGGSLASSPATSVMLLSTAPGGGGSLNYTGTQSTAKVITLLANYDLASDSATIGGVGAGKEVTLTATATVSLPEPSGVIAAFAGMPCMVGLLGFARRLRGRA